MQTLTETDMQEFRQAAEAGDETAKAALAAIGEAKPPESEKAKPEEKPKDGTEAPKAEETPKSDVSDAKTEPKVDQAQEPPETKPRERFPPTHPAVRRIEREKRELRQIVEKQQKQLEALTKRFEETPSPKPKETEEDELNRLLSNPRGYFDERDKRIVEMAKKMATEEVTKNSQEMARRMVERETALKIINNIDGYDDRRDSDDMIRATAEYLNDVYDTDRYDEEEVVLMWQTTPGLVAPVMRKAWNKRRALSDGAKSDKKAATTPASEKGKPTGGRTPNLEDLNAQLAKAMDKGDKKAQDDIMSKIADVLG